MKRILTTTLCLLATGPSFAGEPQAPDAHRPTPSASAGAGRVGMVSFRRDLLPLFRDNCTMCHRADSPYAGLALTPDEAYANLVRVPASGAKMLRVVPGNPERSYLYSKVSGANVRVDGNGVSMPVGVPLHPDEVERIRLWIRQGARNN